MALSTTTRAHWFAVQTRYRYEQRIANDLSSKGLENFLPALREVHEWKDRRKSVEVPAFSGYLFVRFEASLENRVRVLETAGVVRLLGGQGKPEPVAENEIESLRLSLASGAPCTRHPYLAIGAPLRIKRGPLAGLEGRLVRSANALRLVVSVASVGQAIAVEVAREDVDAIEAEEALHADRIHRMEAGVCELFEMKSRASQENTNAPRVG